MTVQTITLHCTENGSDKIYIAEVVEQGDGFVVNFAFGRRGTTLRPGTKTPSPVSEEEALRIWDKLVKSKMKKGYVQTEGSTYTKASELPKDTGLRPMLLTPATEEDMEAFIRDKEWGAQEKLNGHRLMVKVIGGEVIASNRSGHECSIPEEVARPLQRFNVILDGELRDSKYHVFDLLSMNENPLEEAPMQERASLAMKLVSRARSIAVKFVPLVASTKDKRRLVKQLQKDRKEGAVFKRLDSVYAPGRAALHDASQVKVKFYSSGEFVILGWNRKKQSIALAAYDNSLLVNVGNVTVPDKHVSSVETGTVVQVRYLYATDARKLYQPSLDASNGSVTRTDKLPRECSIEQLKFEGKD